MKTVLNLLNNNVMKNAIKYICALLLLVGVNVSAWGDVVVFTANQEIASTTFKALEIIEIHLIQ